MSVIIRIKIINIYILICNSINWSTVCICGCVPVFVYIYRHNAGFIELESFGSLTKVVHVLSPLATWFTQIHSHDLIQIVAVTYIHTLTDSRTHTHFFTLSLSGGGKRWYADYADDFNCVGRICSVLPPNVRRTDAMIKWQTSWTKEKRRMTNKKT